MTQLQNQARDHAQSGPPEIKPGQEHRAWHSQLAEAVQWFLDHDERVAVIRHRSVEELFQWKQQEQERETPGVYHFNTAEDRLAVGIFQAVEANPNESSLHAWIGDLLQALDDSSKLNEEISGAYGLSAAEGVSALGEAAKIPSERERHFYLNACWLEALCTAEARVLGWVYQGLYGRAFHPDTFKHHG